MSLASFVQTSFLGGEWSKAAQGRSEKPEYRTAMNVSLNGLPMEAGAWTRRSGTQNAGLTRNGVAGRVIPFAFQEDIPYTIEFTDSHLRFRKEARLATTNDSQVVALTDGNTPMTVNVPVANTWSTGDHVVFSNLGTSAPLLANREFVWTKVNTTNGTLTDPVTGTAINGTTVGALAAGTIISRVQDVASPFVGVGWQMAYPIQTERYSILVNGITAPQVLTATVSLTVGQDASFALTPVNFVDGPYLNPVTNGALITPSALTGDISLNVSFNAYVATSSYPKDIIVTSGSVNYQSLVDQNLGNTPASSPTKWNPVSAGLAVGPSGFLASDIGRHIRMFSEPPLWVAGTTYAAKDVVSYAGASWSALVGTNTGNQPGLDLTKWGVNATGSRWSWGKITGLLNVIDPALAGSTLIGDLASGGSVASAFDGTTTQVVTASAYHSDSPASAFYNYLGKNFTANGGKAIGVATITLPTDLESQTYQYQVVTSGGNFYLGGIITYFTFNLRGKATAPGSSSDGTLLGTSGQLASPNGQVSIISSDQTTAWNYVWVEIKTEVLSLGTGYVSGLATAGVAELTFFSPAGTGTSTGVTVQILGQDLLYTTPIRTWRMGLYNGTTGWPSCGCYHEGRVWLSGSVGNRIDGACPNQTFNSSISFAPTQPDGSVTAQNAISYTFDADDVNTIFWMKSDQPGIVCGTQAGEWLVQATTLNQPLTAATIQAHRVTKIGCANIRPVHTEHTTVIVQKFKQQIVEYFSDVFSGKFTAPNLSAQAKHLTKTGILEIAYQQELVPTIWARCTNGLLIGTTYRRDTLMTSQGPSINGWHRHTLGSGRLVESVSTGPSSDGNLDALTMVTNDPATGIRHVEIMTKVFTEGDALQDAWFLDNAVVPTMTANVVLGGVSSFQLSGLWHLNGSTVTVFAGGLDCGDYLVTNGSCAVPFGAAGGLFTAAYVAAYSGTMPVVAGFTYTSDGQILRTATALDSGTRSGPAFGKKRRIHQIAMLLESTIGLSFGTAFDRLTPAIFKTKGGTVLPPTTLFSGTFRDTNKGDEDFDEMICWRISRPYPATVASVGGFLDTKDI